VKVEGLLCLWNEWRFTLWRSNWPGFGLAEPDSEPRSLLHRPENRSRAKSLKRVAYGKGFTQERIRRGRMTPNSRTMNTGTSR
jgi:hypothetical protein